MTALTIGRQRADRAGLARSLGAQWIALGRHRVRGDFHVLGASVAATGMTNLDDWSGGEVPGIGQTVPGAPERRHHSAAVKAWGDRSAERPKR